MVDDEPDICELTKLFLEGSGDIDVDTFTSVLQAREQLDRVDYDAAVSDYQMPEIDGISFLKSLRDGGDEIPFILFTGKGREEVAIEALNNGADFYLQKGGSPKALYAELEHMVRVAVKRRRQEIDLREAENRFRLVLDKLPIGLWLADKEGRLILGNPAGQKIWGGYPKVGQDEYSVFKARRLPSREPVLADDWALGHAVNEGVPTDWELLEIDAFDGKSKVIYNWATPLLNDRGEIMGAFVINQEITKEVEALRALEISERKYRTYIERSPFGLFIVGADAHFREANEAACRITGYSMEEILSRTIFDVHNEITLPEASEHFKRTVEQGSASGTIKFVHKSGEIRYWSVNSVALAEDSFMAFVQDVTDHMSMETSLLLKERAVESATSGIALFTLDSRFSFINQRALDILGYSDPDEIIGRSALELQADHRSPPSEIMDLVMSGQTWEGEDELLRKDGRRIFVDMSLHLVTGTDGKPLALMSSISDITERKMMEMALRTANRKLNLLSSITRHDLSNQLTVQIGSLMLAQTNSGSNSHIARALEAARRMDSIIRFTKDYEDLGMKEPRWQCLCSLITEAIDVYEGEMGFAIDIPDDLEIFADDLISEVFINLVQNSLLHGGYVSSIRCWTEKDDDSMLLFFDDDGVGIGEEEKERIFERGYGRNTGQGLFLAREILDLTGMRIDEVGDFGKGAMFRIRIPATSYRRSDS
ncbi:MAG: PAS domain S-box protein [Methanomassiliicoccales archaeon]